MKRNDQPRVQKIDWPMGFSWKIRRRSFWIAVLLTGIPVLYFFKGALFQLFGGIMLAVMIYAYPVVYNYEDFRVDSTAGQVEIGTMFVTNNKGIYHEHGRCHGIFWRPKDRPDDMKVIHLGQTRYPEVPYRPQVVSVSDSGVTYRVQLLAKDKEIQVVSLYVPFDLASTP